MSVEQDIGLRIAKRREALFLTQASLGQAIGDHLGKQWTRQAVWAAERGNRAFTASELIAIAASLSYTVAELMGTDDSPPPLDLDRLQIQASLAEVRRMQHGLAERENALLNQLETGR